MLPARHRSVCSILFLLISAKTTGDILNYKKFTRDLENIFDNGNPIVAVAVIEDKPILRTYVPGNIPRMKRPNNQDIPIELVQENDSTSKQKNALQMTSQNSPVIDDESDEFEGIQLTQKQKSMLRNKWRSSCDKKAAKTCRKACDRARKRACEEYHCKKSISKSFKRHCKSSCKHFFLGDKSKEISD
ncbi:hypothetical protein RR46_01797 [Papilio xuthus]|uniref:Uncharacterized protein n=1 Tax=Papilio xuthus TaxID=66420 RepID=A0A194QHG2_PAPXU|nr:hypothetical protein RR46_01797 [Papilio xuthus]